METEHIGITFKNDEDLIESKYLWKYLDLHKFLSFLITKSLYLTRLDKFEDKREGISPNQLLLKHFKRRLDNNPIFDGMRNLLTIDHFGGTMNEIEDKLKIVQRFNFASCWVVGENLSESAAMWNLYSKPNSIALKIKYSDFKEQFLSVKIETGGFSQEIVCAPINYVDFQNEKNLLELLKLRENLTDAIFIKDSSFSYENEFRVVVKENEREIKPIEYKQGISRRHMENLYNSSYNYPGIQIPLDNFGKFSFEIVHHPKSDEWAKDNIQEILNKFDIDFKVSESDLELN